MMGRTRAALILSGAFLALLLLPAMLVAGQVDEEAIIVKVRADGDDNAKVVTIELTGDDSGWLGVGITDLDETKRGSLGIDKQHVVVVTEIYEDSPAKEAGIQTGDVIVSVSGNDVRSTKQLVEIIAGMDPYTKIEIELLRDGKKTIKNVVLGVRPHRFVFGDDENEQFFLNLEGLGALTQLGMGGLEALGTLERAFFPRVDIGMGWAGKGRLGVYVDNLSDGLAEYFEISDGRGVLVEEIVQGGPAAIGGIRAGDVIIMIGDTRVSDTDELIDAISDMTADVPTPIVIVRKGSEMTLEVTVAESDSDEHAATIKRIQISGDEETWIPPEELEALRDAKKEMLQEKIEALREALEELKEDMEELKADNQ